MSTHSENADIQAYEIMKKRGFETGDIAKLAKYLDRHQKRTMQPFLDRIDARFDQLEARLRAELVSKKEARWTLGLLAALVAVAAPEALDQVAEVWQFFKR